MKVKLILVAILPAVVATLAVLADEAWNGLVKTDMASIAVTRDVSQSKVIPARTAIRRSY